MFAQTEHYRAGAKIDITQRYYAQAGVKANNTSGHDRSFDALCSGIELKGKFLHMWGHHIICKTNVRLSIEVFNSDYIVTDHFKLRNFFLSQLPNTAQGRLIFEASRSQTHWYTTVADPPTTNRRPCPRRDPYPCPQLNPESGGKHLPARPFCALQYLIWLCCPQQCLSVWITDQRISYKIYHMLKVRHVVIEKYCGYKQM